MGSIGHLRNEFQVDFLKLTIYIVTAVDTEWSQGMAPSVRDACFPS